MKEDTVKFLTRENVSNFFSNIERLDIIKYSTALSLESVYKIAYRCGWLISNCPQGSKEYIKHGDRTCRAMWKI